VAGEEQGVAAAGSTMSKSCGGQVVVVVGREFEAEERSKVDKA